MSVTPDTPLSPSPSPSPSPLSPPQPPTTNGHHAPPSEHDADAPSLPSPASPSAEDELDPEAEADDAVPPTAPKKKKKKKSKKKGGAGSTALTEVVPPAPPPPPSRQPDPPVLCISRNKHWKYISSYHGPWLQLPVELLESLLLLNTDVPPSSPPPTPHSPSPTSTSNRRRRTPLSPDPPPDPGTALALDSSLNYPLSPFLSGKPTPPPIDPGVFRSVTSIRRLIDEASDLAVRAASGLSASALSALPSSSSSSLHANSNSAWAAAQTLGIDTARMMGGGGGGGGGRGEGMSALRTHRLRALAVQRLAQAYKADEIAASVMVMQGASALDDVAGRVLKHDPKNADAKYVHFFHEKIPSRQLADSTPTTTLDELIASHPLHLEYFRTRGIVRCFRDEFALACRDFTHVVRAGKARRAAHGGHEREGEGAGGRRGGEDNEDDGPPFPSSAADPLETQCLFLRGAAYLQHAVHTVESACLALEGVRKPHAPDLPDLRLSYLEHGAYGGTEIGNPDGPLGAKDGRKLRAYRARLGAPEMRRTVEGLLRKSIRDHERFLAHFGTLESPGAAFPGNLAERVEAAFLLSESQRPGQAAERAAHQQAHAASPHAVPPPPPLPFPAGPAAFTTYHPLLVESHFSILIALLMLGDHARATGVFQRTAMLVDGLEGYPVFLPARSMAQAEFVEVLERLAGGWRAGAGGNRFSARRAAIEPAPAPVGGEEDTSSVGTSASTTTAPPSCGASSASSGPSSRCDTPVSAAAPPPPPLPLPPPVSATAKGKRPASPPPPPHPHPYPHQPSSPPPTKPGMAEQLDSLRILLAPVIARQRRRQALEAYNGGKNGNGNGNGEKAGKMKTKGVISIPLHGPRVEIVLAWLGGVGLPDLEGVPQEE